MIIWGSMSIETTGERGWFHCPDCRDESRFRRKRVRRWFTLYFVPLFPFKDQGSYVICDDCGAELRPRVLRMTEEDVERLYVPWACPHCSAENEQGASRCHHCNRSPRAKTGPVRAPVSRQRRVPGGRRRRR